MTSLQIAEITGKRHCEVLRAIRNMEPAWEKTTLRKFAYKLKISEIGNGALRETPYYELTKTECLYIATKFNDEARAMLILRWEQLESERLQETQKQPTEAEALPHPSENQQTLLSLVEYVDGKAVTTSRILARVLGRKHDSILDTIKNNKHLRAFKYGHFTTRPYSAGPSHGYEFLITRKGLAALTSVMRYNAKDRIAETYAGAWDGDTKLLPTPKAPVYDPTDVSGTIHELAQRIDNLRAYLRKTQETARMYAGMYEEEKHQRLRNGDMSAYWHDLYEDLMLRHAAGRHEDTDDIMEAHLEFRKRIFKKANS